jgi:NAD(P)-dependent dehydrogenase (short-subunit alcohol dehydrogenase family)
LWPHLKISVQNKVIAITGGSSGIGFALSKLLSTRGATVCIADINPESLAAANSYFKPLHVPFMVTQVDISKFAKVDAWIASVVANFGRLDGAANCAAIIGKHHGIRAITEQDDDEWEKIMNVNLKGVMFC